MKGKPMAHPNPNPRTVELYPFLQIKALTNPLVSESRSDCLPHNC